MRYSPNDAPPPLLPPITPAHRLFRDAAADGGHHTFARDRIHSRSLHRLRLRCRTADRRLRRRIHSARLAQLYSGRRHRLDHIYLHLYAVSGGETRAGCAENILHHHYRDDHRARRRHHPGRDLHASVRRLDVPWLHAGADAALCSSDAHTSAGARWGLRPSHSAPSPAASPDHF